jgi:ATP-binding cassette subfamily B protein
MNMTLQQARRMEPPKGVKLSNLRALFQYIAPYKLHMLGAIFALFITSFSVLGLGKGLGYLIDKGLGQGGNPEVLNTALFLLIAITIMLAIGTFARFFLVTYVGERVVEKMRNQIYERIINLSPEYFETSKSGDILARITNDTSLLQVVIGSSLSVAMRNSVMLFGGMALLMHTSPKLSLIVIFVVPLVLAPIIILGRRLRRLSRATQEKIGTISAHAEETITGIKTIQAYVRENLEIANFHKLTQDACNVSVQRIRLRSILTAIVIMFVFGSIGFVLWVGGQDVVSGRMSAGELSSFIFYSVVVAGATGAISEVFGDLQRASGAMERIMELLSIRSKIESPTTPNILPSDHVGEICFRDVTFSYPNHPEKPSLHNLNLKIIPGETLAIVGPSGAGKSTIFQLLFRFYDASAGEVMIDGINVKNLALPQIRRIFGLVPQDPAIFSGTAFDNIAIGNPDASFDDVVQAAKSAAALEFIESLPHGFDSFLGEKGVRLSGGEKQRIAIARAFLKDPKILLLDEATSALDTHNEALVQGALKMLMKGRTTLIIAHRFSTVQEADRIIVLESGAIVEQGTNAQLMQNNGLYAKLANAGFAV